MTSATSATSTHKPARRGFTLVELLVVIGIIVILISLLLPVIVRAVRQGKRTRAASDLNAIATALDAYKHDFYDYPRIIYTAGSPYNGTASGADVLGKALLSLGNQPLDITASPDKFDSSATYYAGQVVYTGTQQYVALTTSTGQTPAAASAFWTPVAIPANADGTGGGFDGATGPGFRVRAGGSGQIYGPYLQADKFKTRGLAIADAFGNPILYYAASPNRPVATVAANAGSFSSGNSYVGVPITVGLPVSLYNYSDNDTATMATATGDSNFIPTFPAITVLEAMLGNYDFNTYPGYIGPGETPASTASYLLWSAGPDGQYGPVSQTSVSAFQSLTPTDVKKLVNQCDDVTNFTFAQ